MLAEALALVDAEGMDALTVRALATRLGTGSSTSTRHVASRDELLVLLVDAVLGEVRLPDPELPGRVRVEQLSGEAAAGAAQPSARRPGAERLAHPGPERDARPRPAAWTTSSPPAIRPSGPAPPTSRCWTTCSGRSPSMPPPRRPARAGPEGLSDRRSSDDVFAFGLRMFLDGLERG